jgi:hypothetical protein
MRIIDRPKRTHRGFALLDAGVPGQVAARNGAAGAIALTWTTAQ